MVYLVGEGLGAVAVLGRSSGLDKARAVSAVLVIGIVQRVDIYSQPAGVFGQFSAAGDSAVAETR